MKFNLEKLKEIARPIFLPLIVLVSLIPQDSEFKKPIQIILIPLIFLAFILALLDLEKPKGGKK
jgi:hypothetical protein